jgi:fibronectin-binding autotransporter adhesin
MLFRVATRGWWQFNSLFVGGLLLLFFPGLGLAADRVWTGAQNTLWGNNNNWVGNAPAAGDNAVFNSTFSNQPNLNKSTSVGGIWMTGSIGQSVTISASSGTLTLQGNTINGTAGLGILVDNANAFTLTISAPLTIGNAQTWTNSSGNLLTISGAVNINNNALTINGTGNTTVSGVVSNAGALIKAGSGTLTLSNTGDSYTGQLTVQAGRLLIDIINNASANGELGNSALSVILGSSGGATGTLEYTGATASSTKKFTMATGGTGAFQVDTAGTTLTLSGMIDGSGALLKTGPGTLTLAGTNTYSGGTTVSAGTLQLSASGTLGSTSGTLTVNSGTLDVNGTNQTVGALSGIGGMILNNATLTSSTLTVGQGNGTGSYAGVIADHSSGTGILTFTKTGTGTQTLTGVNTYTGPTTVNAGSLFVNGSTAFGSAITVFNSGTTLGGSGTINGSVNLASAGANLSPGASGVGSISILQTGAVTLSLGSNFNVDINGTTAGTGYDQLKVTGTVVITGSNLIVTAGPNLSVGETFFVLLNDGIDPITGLFAQGSTVTASNNGDVFSINYPANGDGGITGNDISLTVMTLPEPSSYIAGILALAVLVYHERRNVLRLVWRQGRTTDKGNLAARRKSFDQQSI